MFRLPIGAVGKPAEYTMRRPRGQPVPSATMAGATNRNHRIVTRGAPSHRDLEEPFPLPTPCPIRKKRRTVRCVSEAHDGNRTHDLFFTKEVLYH